MVVYGDWDGDVRGMLPIRGGAYGELVEVLTCLMPEGEVPFDPLCGKNDDPILGVRVAGT